MLLRKMRSAKLLYLILACY